MKSAFEAKPPKIAEILGDLVKVLRDVVTRAQPAPVVRVDAPVHVEPSPTSPPIIHVHQPPKTGFTCEVTSHFEDGRVKTFRITPEP